MTGSQYTVVSAPGKVLVAGGYLVLDAKYSGLVIATTARFYSAVRTGEQSNIIVIRSPQFEQAQWQYKVDLDTDSKPEIEVQPLEGPKNNFLEFAIQCVLRVARESKTKADLKACLVKGLEVVIAGDNDFYSQREKLDSLGFARTIESLQSLPPLRKLGITLSQVHKTGLGSSAALTTALVTSLLVKLSVIDEIDLSNTADVSSPGLTLAHNVSQYAHCFAQGKVGSGFDVSSAVFGSQIYKRFEPQLLAPLMSTQVAIFMPQGLGTILTTILAASSNTPTADH